MRVAICDDEKYYLDKIADSLDTLLSHRGIRDRQIETFSEAEVLLEKFGKIDYDVVFLDINMPKVNGLDMAKQMKAIRPLTILIFVTAFADYSIIGYKLEIFRYLLKDTLDEALPECVDDIIKKLSLRVNRIWCDFIGGKKNISIDCICYIESKGHKLIFHLEGEKSPIYSLYDRLDLIEKRLPEYRFLRIHKSYLVNIQYVEDFSNYQVYLKDRSSISVPRDKYQAVRERYYAIKGDLL